jgi:hypothetical protein
MVSDVINLNGVYVHDTCLRCSHGMARQNDQPVEPQSIRDRATWQEKAGMGLGFNVGPLSVQGPRTGVLDTSAVNFTKMNRSVISLHAVLVFQGDHFGLTVSC